MDTDNERQHTRGVSSDALIIRERKNVNEKDGLVGKAALRVNG